MLRHNFQQYTHRLRYAKKEYAFLPSLIMIKIRTVYTLSVYLVVSHLYSITSALFCKAVLQKAQKRLQNKNMAEPCGSAFWGLFLNFYKIEISEMLCFIKLGFCNFDGVLSCLEFHINAKHIGALKLVVVTNHNTFIGSFPPVRSLENIFVLKYKYLKNKHLNINSRQ